MSESSDPFCIVSYYIRWATTSWTHSIMQNTMVGGIYAGKKNNEGAGNKTS